MKKQDDTRVDGQPVNERRPTAASHEGLPEPTCFWCRNPDAGPLLITDDFQTAICGDCAKSIALFWGWRRTLTGVVAQLRHAYANMNGAQGTEGAPIGMSQSKRFAAGLIAPQIRALEGILQTPDAVDPQVGGSNV